MASHQTTRLSCFEFFKFRVKKVYNMAARGVGLFDSSDDEEEFLGFTREDIPLRGEESDSNASVETVP